jgi:hypothetical protein
MGNSDRSRSCTPGLGDVARLSAIHCATWTLARFAVPRGDGGGLLKKSAVGLGTIRAAQDNMTPRLIMDMEPKIIGSSKLKRKQVIVEGGLAGIGAPAASENIVPIFRLNRFSSHETHEKGGCLRLWCLFRSWNLVVG